MTTSYPGAIDTLTNPTPSDTLNSATVPHAAQHANLNDAMEAVQTTLGTNPQGSDGTVKGRFIALEGAVLNLNNAIDERVPGETGSNQPVGARPDGYIWVDTATHAIKVWNGTAYVDPSNAGGGSGVPWASISGGTETPISDGGTNYLLHRFNANGTLTVTQAGYVEVLLVGAGGLGNGANFVGGAGDILRGLFWLDVGPATVTVGSSGVGIESRFGGATAVGPHTTSLAPWYAAGASTGGAVGAGSTAANAALPYTSTFTGASDTYGLANQASPRANKGDGGTNAAGSAGVALIRVPA